MCGIVRIYLGLLIIAVMFFGCFPSSEDLSVRKVEKVHFENLGEDIYLKRIERGLNYQVSVISTSSKKKFEPNYENEYVFSAGTASFYYKVSGDTLFIKSYILAKKPKNFPSKIKVKQIELNQQELKDFKGIYKKEGYSFFGGRDTPILPPRAEN